MKITKNISLTSLAGLLIFLPVNGFAESPLTIETAIDSVEVQLELGRHEKFLETRNGEGCKLSPFTTDGCSGGLSVGWQYLAQKVDSFQQVHNDKPPWESCCITHDQAYHIGGDAGESAEMSFMARKNADEQLKSCVVQTATHRLQALSEAYNISEDEVESIYKVIGALMYRAVRVGGMPCTGLPWRWGYGWPECE